MPIISLDLRLKDVGVTSVADGSKFTAEFAAHHTFQGFRGRRLVSGGHLEDLRGYLRVIRRTDDKSVPSKLPGHLRYIAADPAYRTDECYAVDLAPTEECFKVLESWIGRGTPPTSVDLFLDSSDAVNDGPEPDIDVDEQWDNKTSPEVAVRWAHFRLPSSQHQLEDDRERSWRRLYETAARMVDSFYAPQEDDYQILEPGRINRDAGAGEVWFSRMLAANVANSVVAYHCEHFDQVNLFESRLQSALALLSRLRCELNPLTGKPNSLHDGYRKRLTDKEQRTDPKAWIWCHLDVAAAIRGGESVRDYWPIVMQSVSDLCFEYLSMPWMESPELEVAIADALTYQTTLTYGAGYRYWRILIPFRYQMEAKLLREMVSLCRLLNDRNLWPEFIKGRLLAIAEKGVRWPAGLVALVEHAVRRNSVKWIV